MSHTHHLRTAMVPFLEASVVRPSFVAHIALELMLDSLLLSEKSLNADLFYSYLNSADLKALDRFFDLNHLANTSIFYSFLDEFIDAQYLKKYSDPKEIVYAINRICMRVWDDPFNETQKLQLKAILIDYREKLKDEFMVVFDEIEGKLAS
jgi:hypothetical protein